MTNTDERRDEVLEKYTPLFMRQPHFVGYGNGFLRDDAMGWTDKLGINVYGTKKTGYPPALRVFLLRYL